MQVEPHIELLIGAVTQINEPDSIYGIIQTHKVRQIAVIFFCFLTSFKFFKSL